MRVALIAHRIDAANSDLAAGWRKLGVDARVLAPGAALARLMRGDVALLRIDVRPALDGVEEGLALVPALRFAGVRILNEPSALLGAHDKIETARRLGRAGLPHPTTVPVFGSTAQLDLQPPVVVKPRYGARGRDIHLCATAADLRRCLEELEGRVWFRRGGAVVQSLVVGPGRECRVTVAGGLAVAYAERTAPTGEWRTSAAQPFRAISGAPVAPALRLAVAAAESIGGDLVSVDLLSDATGGHVVLEVNVVAELDRRHALPGTDAHARAAAALGLEPRVAASERAPALVAGRDADHFATA